MKPGSFARTADTRFASEMLARATQRATIEGARQVDGAHVLWALLESDQELPRQALVASGADLHRLRELLQPPEALLELRRRLRDVEAEKQRAVDKQDYAAAGNAYMQEQQLRTELAEFETDWSNPGTS